MKAIHTNTRTRTATHILAGAIAVLLARPSAQAVNATWNGTTDTAWATTTNWSASPVPGTGNTATFNNAGNGNTVINLGGVTINTVLLDSALAAGYTFGTGGAGGQTLTLNDSGAVTMNSTVAADELFNANMALGTATAGGYTFTNNSATNTLRFAGTVQGGTGGTGAAKALTINGSGNTTISGVIANGGATSLAMTQSGAGTLTLNGSAVNTSTGGVSVNGGTLALDFANLGTPTDLLNNTNALTLGGGVLNVQGRNGNASAQSLGNVTVNSGDSRIAVTGGSSSTMNLTLGNTWTRNTGGTVNFILGTGGTVTSNPALTNGIIGPWASIGSGASTQYATINTGVVAGLTGTAAADGSGLTDVTGTVNYELAAGGGTVPATVSANTIRYAGAAGTTAPGATSFSVNGLMSAGTGLWTIGANRLTIGVNKELIVNTAGSDITISSGIANNAGGASSITKTGSGTLTLSGNNTFTGGVALNAGTLNITGVNTGVGTILVGSISAATLNVSGVGSVASATNGNRLLTIGAGSAGGNSVTISSPGTQLLPSFVGVGANVNVVQIGLLSSNNTLTVSNGAFFGLAGSNSNANQSDWTVGTNALATATNNNALIITGAGSVFDRTLAVPGGIGAAGSAMNVGPTGDGNRVIVSAGGLFRPRRLEIGASSDVNVANANNVDFGTNNYVQITGNGSQTIITDGTSNAIFEMGATPGANGNYLSVEAGGYFEYTGNSNGNANLGLIRNFRIGGAGHNNYLAVTGAGSLIRVNNYAPLTLGGLSSNASVNDSLNGTGNHLDINNGGWADLTFAGFPATGLTTPVYAVGINSAVNLGNGTGIGTLKAGVLGAANFNLGSVYLKNASGRLNFNGGRLIAGATGVAGTTTVPFVSGLGQIQLNGSAYVNVSSAATVANGTISVVITGGAGGTLTKENTGTLTLAAANTYTDTTIIDGGTLNDGNGTTGSLNGIIGTALTFTGTGTFNANQASGVSQGMGALTFSAGAAQVQITNAGTSSLTFGSLTARSAGATANFVKSGAGATSIVLGGQGTGVIDRGTYFGGSDYAYYDAGNFVRALAYTDPSAATSGAAVSVASATHQEITGAITAQTNATFTTLKISGASDLTLDTAQTVTVNGLLKTGANTATISGGAGIQAASNAEMVVRADVAGDTLALNTPILANGSNALTKDGAGTVTLGVTNTYTGTTTINSGTVSYGVDDAIAGGAVTINNGTLAMTTFNDTVGAVTLREGAITGGGGTLTSTAEFTLNPMGTAAVSANLAGGVALVKNGLGTTSLTGANTYSGTTTINAGTLTAGSAGALPTGAVVVMGTDPSASLNLANISRQLNSLTGGSATGGGVTLGTAILTMAASTEFTYSGIISGTGGVTKTGTGAWTVAGKNSYSGATNINVGTLKFGEAGSNLGSPLGLGNTTVAAGATLDLNGFPYFASAGQTLTLNGTGVSGNGALINASGSRAIFDGLVVLGSASSIIASNGDIVLPNTGTITGNTRNLTLGGAAAASSIFGIIGTTTGTVTKTGSGTWTLAGANTYSGNTLISAGTLQLGNNRALQNSALDTSGAGSLAFSSGITTPTFGGLTGGGNLTLPVGVTALTLKTGTGVNTGYSGALGSVTPGLTLTKSGAGAQTLIGATTYTGATSITQGTLNITNTAGLSGTSGVTVAGSSALNYVASANAPLAINGTLSLAASSTIGGSIGSTATMASIAATGTATGTGAVTVNLFGITGVSPANGTYTLVSGTGASTLNVPTYTLGTVFNATNFTVGALSSTTNTLDVGITAPAPLGAAYWQGTYSGAPGVWAASNGSTSSNWTTDGAGTATSLTPGGGTNLIFSDAGGASNQTTMSLGSSMTVNSITVNGAIAPTETNNLALSSAGGHTLTIGTTASPGITVIAGSGSVTLNPKIKLGLAQTWTNDSGLPLTVAGAVNTGGFVLASAGLGDTVLSGVISGAGGVTKTGTGTLALNGASLAFDNLTANDGTANVNGILGTGTGTAMVSVTDTAGGAPTTLRFGSVSQTLNSLSIGAGATVVFTSSVASGAFSDGGGKAGGFGGAASNFGTGSAVVPEPGTIGLLLAGALGVLHRRRRPM